MDVESSRQFQKYHDLKFDNRWGSVGFGASMVLLMCARTVHCGAENDIDRASLHGLSIEAAVRSNFHACVVSFHFA